MNENKNENNMTKKNNNMNENKINIKNKIEN
jgi:hypothetical protein